MNTFQQRVHHLEVAHGILNPDPLPPPPPPLRPAPSASLQVNASDDVVKIVTGRTVKSQNLLYHGFRYSKDGMLTTTGLQAWRCVLKNEKCKGRIYTLNGRLHSIMKHHNHDSDIADCELRS